jgi:hypothetical protein
VNELAQFLAYTTKVFQLKQRLRAVRDERVYPVIPTQAVLLSLLFAVVLRVGSYLALSQKTARRRWRHLIHWDETISDDTLDYVTERLRLDDLRQWLVAINRELKTNKVLEPAKINGLLFLSLDANEHFHSESYCCESCCRREVTQHDSKGQKQTVTQFYHRYVFAQISGAKVTLLLDLEPIRPGEDEAGAALRLLGRIRRLYGPRFFDAVTVDGWYAQGPFLRAIEKLGWDWVVVLKKERMGIASGTFNSGKSKTSPSAKAMAAGQRASFIPRRTGCKQRLKAESAKPSPNRAIGGGRLPNASWAAILRRRSITRATAVGALKTEPFAN